jgi:hypothetical protein
VDPHSPYLQCENATCTNSWHWESGGVEGDVAREFRLPVASFRRAVWEKYDAPPADLPLIWNAPTDGLHIGATSHMILADAIKYALGRLLFVWPKEGNFSDEPVLVSNSSSGISRTCKCTQVVAPTRPVVGGADTPTSCAGRSRTIYFGVEYPEAFEAAPVKQTADWSFRRGASPAWVGTVPPSGAPPPVLVFPVVFHGILDLEYQPMYYHYAPQVRAPTLCPPRSYEWSSHAARPPSYCRLVVRRSRSATCVPASTGRELGLTLVSMRRAASACPLRPLFRQAMLPLHSRAGGWA